MDTGGRNSRGPKGVCQVLGHCGGRLMRHDKHASGGPSTSTYWYALREPPIVPHAHWTRQWPPKAHPPPLFSLTSLQLCCPHAMAANMMVLSDMLASMLQGNNQQMVRFFALGGVG